MGTPYSQYFQDFWHSMSLKGKSRDGAEDFEPAFDIEPRLDKGQGGIESWASLFITVNTVQS